MIFNTVFAEEVEVLENDNEVTETVLTTNVEETNTTDTSNDVKEENEQVIKNYSIMKTPIKIKLYWYRRFN